VGQDVHNGPTRFAKHEASNSPFLVAQGVRDLETSLEDEAFAVSLVVCLRWKFDALSMTILSDRISVIGQVVTAAVIAGGSKGSMKLFRDVLGWKSSAYADYEAAKKAEAPERIAQLRAQMAERQPSEPAH
jgi:hypothetical protein